MCNFYKYKLIPQNYLAEDILIGIILIYPAIINKTKNLITPNIFFIEKNKFIYSKLINEENDNTINLLNEAEYTKIANLECYVNCMIQMMRKSQAFISYCNTNNYVENIIRILRTAYIKRLFIQLGYNIIRLGYNTVLNNNSAYTKILEYTNNIEKEIRSQEDNRISNIKKFISQKLIGIRSEKRSTNYKLTNGQIKSGFINLDRIIHNLPTGNLIIVAGRPSIGKTSFSINIAYNCFIENNINLLIFSLEMTSNQIFDKFIKINSKIQLEQKKIDNFTNTSWKKLSKICDKLLQQNIYINETPNLSIKQIEIISSELQQNQFIKLIVIDYLQLIEASFIQKTISTRNQEIGYITRRLKLLAQYLKIPLIVISQLNRNIENRINKEPLLSDLKESGCIGINTNVNQFQYHQIKLSTKPLNFTIKTLSNSFLKIKEDIISTLNKYIFKCYTRQNHIYLTYNHKIFYRHSWIKVHHVTQSTNIFAEAFKNDIQNFRFKKFLKAVSFFSIYKTYDIHIKNYFNFRINTIKIHNSIEQDADIIMILYETKNEENNDNEIINKTIDLKVAKNRNGHTGYCKLIFQLYNNVFQDI